MNNKAREQFYYNLGIMLEAGVDIRKAVSAQKPRLFFGRRLLAGIKQGVSDGQTLTETLGQYPRHFPVIERELIEAGERSGNLNEICRILSNWLTFKRQMMAQFMSGMWMPGFLIHAVAFIPGFFMMVFGKITLGQYLLGAWGVLSFFYIPAAVMVGIFKLTPQTGPARLLMDGLLIRIPVLGRALKTMALSLFCSGFRMMLRAGIMIDESIEKAARGCGNAVICRRLFGGGAAARNGQAASTGFKPGLPVEFMESWWVGEETGNLDGVADRLASVYTEEARRRIAAWCFWFPRLIYLLILIMVGLTILQFWSGYYNAAMSM